MNKPGNFFNLIGVGLSASFFLVLGLITSHYTEERFLVEAAKELTGMINNECFFLIHRERIFFIVSQIFPLAGLKAGLSLNAVMHLYSFNFFLITLVIYLVCLFFFKDYYAGIYLCSFGIITVGVNFFKYPFLEHYYALAFTYLMYHIFNKYQNGNAWWLALIGGLGVCIVSLQPVAILYIAVLLVFLKKNLKWKFLFLCFLTLVLILTLLYTETSIQSRISSMDLNNLPERIMFFCFHNPDLVLLILVTVFIVIKSSKRITLLTIIGVSMFPYIFYPQFPSYYYMLPCGISLLLFATNQKLKTNFLLIGFVTLLFGINIYRVTIYGKVYREIYTDVMELIDAAREQGGSKFILVKNDKTSHYFDTPLDYFIEENIKHVSLLFSSRHDRSKALIIESFDFSAKAFSDPGEFDNKFTEEHVIDFIDSLYEKNESKTLYPEHQDKYEYSKMFFTNTGLNSNYFKINRNDSYQILKPGNI